MSAQTLIGFLHEGLEGRKFKSTLLLYVYGVLALSPVGLLIVYLLGFRTLFVATPLLVAALVFFEHGISYLSVRPQSKSTVPPASSHQHSVVDMTQHGAADTDLGPGEIDRRLAEGGRLSLLYNVSRHAIAAHNPDEMLAKIIEQLEAWLTYDHIGIGVLDYATREVVIQAEAGKRRSTLGQRITIGTGLIGLVAGAGQMAVYRQGGSMMPLLPDSVSAIALPVFYTDQLHGILYVESSTPVDFSEEEVLLLGTLADVIGGALHNALSLQKAQEQAITDGLTGVKTHRFFMEALSSEWKRSTRAGRAFALVLLELDRFKFVNDFYGHLEGDIVLQRVGQILETNCRRSDVVARYGGDEFVILMPETNMEHARQWARKLRGWVSSDPLLREKNISASFGIACYPLHGSSPQEIIQVADASLYLSKHQGGNEVRDPNQAKKWERDELEPNLGVGLRKFFATGPDALKEVCQHLIQFTESWATLPQAVIETVTSLVFALDARDRYTQGHSLKVADYAGLIAMAMELSNAEIQEIRLGGMLHDIGKVGISEDILNKGGPLNPDEWETMKSHVKFGAKILEPLTPLAHVRDMVLHHHEYFDGSGYPEGLAGNKIPLGARIIAIAEAYDTITSDRTYKNARSASDALAELERCANAQFDGEIVSIFIRMMRGSIHLVSRYETARQPAEPAGAAEASGRRHRHFEK
jgi:diguanylate cyclase (GGDEF)-like protein/putative nucleotidyltransferase with HDIG domain